MRRFDRFARLLARSSLCSAVTAAAAATAAAAVAFADVRDDAVTAAAIAREC